MKNKRGITLVALVITIIVMLILVGVVIAINLDDGPINKANDAKTKTEITEIEKEIFRVKENIIAKNDGEEPDLYDIGWEDLNISEDLKTKYESKVVIGSDGKLYTSSTLTDEKEKELFEDLGITDIWWTLRDGELEQMVDITDTLPSQIRSIPNLKLYKIASSDNDNNINVAIYCLNDEVAYVGTYDYNDLQYSYITIKSLANIWNQIFSTNVYEAGYWFSNEYETGSSVHKVTKCPISISDFSEGTIYCRSYLERIINSFNN